MYTRSHAMSTPVQACLGNLGNTLLSLVTEEEVGLGVQDLRHVVREVQLNVHRENQELIGCFPTHAFHDGTGSCANRRTLPSARLATLYMSSDLYSG